MDGCRLAWQPWDVEIPALYEKRERSYLAHIVFEQEAQILTAEDIPLWQQAGIPLAMAHFAEDRSITFVDRYAVVRRGGLPRPRACLVPGTGNIFLRQARIQQLASHMQDLVDSGKSIDQANEYFGFLPSVGVLPKSLVDLETLRSEFFPSTFQIEVSRPACALDSPPPQWRRLQEPSLANQKLHIRLLVAVSGTLVQ